MAALARCPALAAALRRSSRRNFRMRRRRWRHRRGGRRCRCRRRHRTGQIVFTAIAEPPRLCAIAIIRSGIGRILHAGIRAISTFIPVARWWHSIRRRHWRSRRCCGSRSGNRHTAPAGPGIIVWPATVTAAAALLCIGGRSVRRGTCVRWRVPRRIRLARIRGRQRSIGRRRAFAARRLRIVRRDFRKTARRMSRVICSRRRCVRLRAPGLRTFRSTIVLLPVV
jgi:hypothetical protein